MTLSGLTLLRPFWLVALAGLALLAFWLRRRRGGLGDWTRVADPALLRALEALGRVAPGGGGMPGRVALTVAVLLVLALAGPAVERRDALSFRNLDGVVLVADLSRSVAEDPRWPQLLTMGRFAVAALGSRPAGLVVFAGDAYVATDMTADTAQLGQTLSVLGPDTVPDPGSRPERGLRLAARMLREAEVLNGDVVLLTDGGGLGPNSLAAAAAIAGQGARLSVVQIGAATAETRTHVAAGGGRAFGLADTDALAAWLSDAARTRLERQDYPLLFWHELGRWLLALALMPALLLFRRRA